MKITEIIEKSQELSNDWLERSFLNDNPEIKKMLENRKPEPRVEKKTTNPLNPRLKV